MKKLKKEHKAFLLGALAATIIVGGIALTVDYVKCHVPEFVRMHGAKYIIHFLQGKDAFNEIYTKIGI